jgi:hypothetical protein
MGRVLINLEAGAKATILLNSVLEGTNQSPSASNC